MKLLHLADLHLGKTVLEAPMLEEQEAFLKKILELVDERGVDAVLMAGDLYDRSVPPAEAVELLDGFLSALSGRGIPVLAAAGNHDSPERLDFGSRIFTRGGLYIAGRYRPELTRVRLADAHGPVDVTLLPFLRPVTVRAALSTAPQEQDGEKGEAGIRTTEDAVRAALAACPPEPGVRQVLVAHQFVCAGGMPPATCDSETPYAGGVEAVDVSCFDGYDYVALGHLHRPQRVGRDTVRYAGSPLKYSLSEAGHVKSCPLVTLGLTGVEDIELIPLRPPHDLRRVKGELEELLEMGRGREEAGDYLWAVLTGERVPDPAERLRTVYPRLLHVEYQQYTAGGSVEEEIQAEKALSPGELFERFYHTMTGGEPTARQRELLTAALDRAARKEEKAV